VGAVPAYTVTARVLHWITAAAILLMLPLGWASANEWGGSWQDWLYNLHRSIGAALIPIMLVRVIYRLMRPPLPLPEQIPAMQRLAAAGTHGALYALLLAQPVIGWIATSAYPAPIPVFGLFELPPLWGARCRTGYSRYMRPSASPLLSWWRCTWPRRAITTSYARTASSCA
jgi:cytochrome b561